MAVRSNEGQNEGVVAATVHISTVKFLLGLGVGEGQKTKHEHDSGAGRRWSCDTKSPVWRPRFGMVFLLNGHWFQNCLFLAKQRHSLVALRLATGTIDPSPALIVA